MAADPSDSPPASSTDVSVEALAQAAGYRLARWRDIPAVLRLTSSAERSRPGLLGRASRQFPGWLIRPLVSLSIFSWLVAGLVVFDPAGAALVALPVKGLPHRTSFLVSLAAASVVGILAVYAVAGAVAAVTGMDVRTVAAVITLTTITVPTAFGLRRIWSMNGAHRALKADAPGPIVNVGAYFGRPGVAAEMAAALMPAADRYAVTLLAQTTGEARIRLYRAFGFKVSSIEDRARPGVDARVYLVRFPAGHGHDGVEPAAHLWRDAPMGRETARPEGRATSL